MKKILKVGLLTTIVGMLIFTACNKKALVENSETQQTDTGIGKLSAAEIKCKGYLELIHKKLRTQVTRSEAVEYIEGAINYG